MAEWHELSETEKGHANVFVDLIDSLNEAEKRAFDAIKHDYNQLKAWLDRHPKIRNSGAVFGGLTALYIGKRCRMAWFRPR